jgi:hypothetical protein
MPYRHPNNLNTKKSLYRRLACSLCSLILLYMRTLLVLRATLTLIGLQTIRRHWATSAP